MGCSDICFTMSSQMGYSQCIFVLNTRTGSLLQGLGAWNGGNIPYPFDTCDYKQSVQGMIYKPCWNLKVSSVSKYWMKEIPVYSQHFILHVVPFPLGCSRDDSQYLDIQWHNQPDDEETATLSTDFKYCWISVFHLGLFHLFAGTEKTI